MHLKANIFLFVAFCLEFCNFSNAFRKCEKKCRNYAKLVYAKEIVPVLRIDVEYKPVSKCGIVETPLIIGGIKAKPQEFPHMAVIGYGNGSDISWQCGGSLISENFILTAAHCVESLDKGPASRIRIGMTNLKNPESAMQERCVIERIRHPNYKLPSRYDDIALLKLDRPLDLNGDVRPACLGTEPVPSGKFTIATGFGKTAYENIEGSDDLMKVQLTYVSQKDCEQSYEADTGSKSLPKGIKSSMLCAGIFEGGKDTCQGDSGGPLQQVLEDPYCMYSIVGITSFGKFCGFKNSPAVYTRVSSYLDWIESIVWP